MSMRRLFAAALLTAAACSEEGGQTKQDPCALIICHQGEECRDGVCVDREPPTEDCTSNTECLPVPGRPYCSLRTGNCVQCTQDVHCPGGGTCVNEVCDDGKCDSNAECPENFPLCRDDGQCVVCLDSAGCPEGKVCSAGDCRDERIDCTSNPDCQVEDPGRPVCLSEPGGGRCVECVFRSDCGAGEDCVANVCERFACVGDDCSAFPDRPHCDNTGLCVECLEASQCGEGELCLENACEPEPGCQRDEDCAGDPAGELCNEATGDCVVCVSTADCPVGTECAQDGSACTPLACGQQEDCPPGFLCDAGACAEGPACTGDDGCDFDPRATRCNEEGRCVTCLDGGDCARGLACQDGLCQDVTDCTEDVSCSGGYVCEDQDCVACRLDDDCPRGACVDGFCANRSACTSQADCAMGVCARGTCVECAGDLDCRPGLWCSGGSCVEAGSCTGTADCGPDRVCTGGACTDERCIDDEREPDSTIALARPAPASGPVFGKVCPNDDDWIVIAANAGVGFETSLSAAPPGTELALFWFDEVTGELRRRDGIADRIRVRSLPEARQDRYYMRVRSTGAGQYIVINKVTAAGLDCADPLEPNDTRQKPSPIAHGRFLHGLTACGDFDWMSFSTAPGLPVRAYVFSASPVDVGLFDASGSSVADDPARAVPYLGGGKVVEALGAKHELLGSYLLRVSSSQNPAEYEVYVVVGEDPVCAGPPVLLEAGDDRERLQDTTLGRRLDAPVGSCGAGGPDALYEITLQRESRLLASVAASYDARLSLLSPGCGVERSCAPFQQGRGSIDIPRLAAGTYVLAVGGSTTGAGPFDLAVRALPTVNAPANDRCAGATHLDVSGGGASAAGETLGAAADIDVSCSVPVPEVFYGFSLPAQQRVILDVAADAPVYAAFLDAASCTNERACGVPGTRVHLDVTLPAGDHTLAIGSATGVASAFELDLVVPPPVTNETCAAATPLTVPSTVAGDTTYARNDLDFGANVSCTSYFTAGHDVFYRFSGAQGQSYEFTVTPGAGHDLAVYVVGECAAPQCLVGADAALAGEAEKVTFQAPANGTYRVVVDGAEGGGTFTLQAK